jgi:hypothetical protein
MAPAGGAPTQEELHGDTTDAAKAVDDALAAIGIPSEAVDATDLSATAKIVEETGADPAQAFQQVMADQIEGTTDAADSAGTVSDGLEEGTSSGEQAESEQLPGSGEARGGQAAQGDSAVEGAEPDRTGNAENAEDGATGNAAEAENADVAAKPTEAEEKAASDAIEGALNKIEEAVEAKDRAGVLAAARVARKVLSDTPQAIKDAEPEYWGQFSAVIRRMAKPGYVTATQEAKAAEADVQAADTEEPTTTAFVPTALDKPATEDENKARIEDAGEKLGGARKDQWSGGITVDDLGEMSGAERHKNITKEKVWPRLDYAQLVEDGVDPEAAFLIKAIYDRLPTTPQGKEGLEGANANTSLSCRRSARLSPTSRQRTTFAASRGR